MSGLIDRLRAMDGFSNSEQMIATYVLANFRHLPEMTTSGQGDIYEFSGHRAFLPKTGVRRVYGVPRAILSRDAAVYPSAPRGETGGDGSGFDPFDSR